MILNRSIHCLQAIHLPEPQERIMAHAVADQIHPPLTEVNLALAIAQGRIAGIHPQKKEHRSVSS